MDKVQSQGLGTQTDIRGREVKILTIDAGKLREFGFHIIAWLQFPFS